MFPAMMSVSDALVPATGTVTSIYLAGSAVGTMLLPGSMGERFKVLVQTKG